MRPHAILRRVGVGNETTTETETGKSPRNEVSEGIVKVKLAGKANMTYENMNMFSFPKW